MFTLFFFAYLLGSFPTALIIGKVFYGIDIRKYGSFNPGATNSLRVLGKRAGIIVLLVDVSKGAFAAALPFFFEADIDPLYLGLAAVIGHCFPIFAGFRGGKAIATTAGALLIANPLMLFISYSTFFLVIFMTKYVFLGSISIGITLLLYALIEPGLKNELLFFLYLILLIYLHRSNIINFFHYQEPMFNDKKLKKDRIPPKKKP